MYDDRAHSDVTAPISPCGLCRQVLCEFCKPEMPVLLVPADYRMRQDGGEKDGGVLEISMGELLPYIGGMEIQEC